MIKDGYATVQGVPLTTIIKQSINVAKQFLNQARASCRPAHAWFLKIDPVRTDRWYACSCVYVCVCPRPRLSITNGVIWHDMNLIQLVKQVLQLLYGNCSCYCYGRGLGIGTCHTH